MYSRCGFDHLNAFVKLQQLSRICDSEIALLYISLPIKAFYMYMYCILLLIRQRGQVC